MERKTYACPEEAYAIANSWTVIKTNYESELLGKKVTRVDLDFKGDQPRLMSVFWNNDDQQVGVMGFDLTQKMLLDSPEGEKFTPSNSLVNF